MPIICYQYLPNKPVVAAPQQLPQQTTPSCRRTSQRALEHNPRKYGEIFNVKSCDITLLYHVRSHRYIFLVNKLGISTVRRIT